MHEVTQRLSRLYARSHILNHRAGQFNRVWQTSKLKRCRLNLTVAGGDWMEFQVKEIAKKGVSSIYMFSGIINYCDRDVGSEAEPWN